jgi:hypothetical protein
VLARLTRRAPNASASPALCLEALAIPVRLGRVDVKLQQCSAELPGQLANLLDVGVFGIDLDRSSVFSPTEASPARSHFRSEGRRTRPHSWNRTEPRGR